MNKNLLMSYEEYLVVKHKTPYFYTHKSNNQFIYYFGSHHSRDVKDPQFDLMKQKWKEFTDVTDGMKRIVIIEANNIPKIELDFEKSVFARGEAGTGAYLANESGSTLVFGEPKQSEIINYLLKKFTKEEILLFFVCIAINHWYKNKNGRTIQEFLSDQTKKYSELLNWIDLEISVDLINKIYKDILKKELNIEDEKIFSQITSPVKIESRINELSRSQSIFRNNCILGKIEKYWKEGFNIFVIYGAGHAVMQEPVICSLTN